MNFFLSGFVILKFLFIHSALNAADFKSPDLEPNDLSVLLPLPDSVYLTSLLTTKTVGSEGILLPDEYATLLPKLSPDFSTETLLTYLRVVSVRLDPCFAESGSKDKKNCRAQIRLVWQPLLPTLQNIITVDAAVHTFYELSQSEFKLLVHQISQLRRQQSDAVGSDMNSKTIEALGIHPIIALEGMGGPYWLNLRELLLVHLGNNRLSKITFFNTIAVDAMWDFGGFDINLDSNILDSNISNHDFNISNSSASKVFRIMIPRIKTQIQSFINKDLNGIQFRGGIRPQPNLQNELNAITSQSSKSLTQPTGFFIQALHTADTLENPTLRNPENTDCVSCHVAGTSRIWILDELNRRNAIPTDRPFQYRALDQAIDRAIDRATDRALDKTFTSTSGQNTLNLHSFGYYRGKPSISQRVVNETTAIILELKGQTRAENLADKKPTVKNLAKDFRTFLKD